jgi:apolipoprotein N-acyltransferase
MKDVLSTVSKILFYALALAVVVWTASLTVSLVSRLLPGDTMTPFFALALFDGGALVWFLAFMFSAAGLPQRAISLLAMVLDLIGVIGVSIAELFLGGQQLASIPDGLGNLVVWAVGLWTALNLVALYAYHLADPDEMTEIRIRSLQDQVQAQALEQVESMVRDEASGLAGVIAADLRSDVLARLRLLKPGEVIEGTLRDAPRDTEQDANSVDPTTARKP